MARAKELKTTRLPNRPSMDLARYEIIKLRAGTLKIPHAELVKCKSLKSLKALAQRYYHKRAKELHPDLTKAHRYTQKFERVQNTAQWFASITEKDFLSMKKVQETLPDIPIPWHMERKPRHLGPGFQETREPLWYQ